MFKKGDRISSYTLVEQLGKGGNAEVWRATSDGGDIALKILTRTSGDCYHRFRNEIAVHKELREFPGILPVLAFNLPQTPTHEDPAWLTMPIAEPCHEKLTGQSTELAVEAVRDFAVSLAKLHSRNIFHRDIKPENLYYLDGRWLVGDFGLVQFPNKEQLTLPGKKLGPAYYHAPEMLTDPSTAAGGPADVWSLAKTLWTLVSDARWPLPGHQRSDDEYAVLDGHVNHTGLRPLNRLIDHATRLNPGNRPSMQEFGAELETWINPVHEPTGPTDFSPFRNEFADILDGDRHLRDLGERYRHEIGRVMGTVQASIKKLADLFRTANVHVETGSSWYLAQHPPNSVENVEAAASDHFETIVSLRGVTLLSTFFVQITSSESLLLTVGHAVVGSGEKLLYEWWASKTVPLGSADEPHAYAELEGKLFAESRPALQVLGEMARTKR